jgi:hypothetical protein
MVISLRHSPGDDRLDPAIPNAIATTNSTTTNTTNSKMGSENITVGLL